jgi:uncharacterized protein (DUF1330 family)
MAFDIINVLFVTDRERYEQYRAEIAPLLKAVGGAFRYDFEIAKTLKSEANHDINRLFVLRFPSREAKERFFTDSCYLEIRARLFEPAVRGITTIAEQAN